MRFFYPAILVASAALLQACSGDPAADEPRVSETVESRDYKVYFLAGQSNMDGYGEIKDLPDELDEPVDGVVIFEGRMREDDRKRGGVGVWQTLEPGFGTGFDTNGRRNRLARTFGPELSFGRRMQALQPDENIAIIKYARGGTALVHGVSSYGSWDPDYDGGDGINQHDHALATIANALAVRDIDGDGAADRLVPAGIVWMQGEADAANVEAAAMAYEGNLARQMDLFRDALSDNLPVVIGRIKDSGDTPETRVMQFSPEVQAQQKSFVETDDCAALVTVTEEFSFRPDGWHYVSDNYLTLGTAFADEMMALEGRC